jgi:hypothetical protein
LLTREIKSARQRSNVILAIRFHIMERRSTANTPRQTPTHHHHAPVRFLLAVGAAAPVHKLDVAAVAVGATSAPQPQVACSDQSRQSVAAAGGPRVRLPQPLHRGSEPPTRASGSESEPHLVHPKPSPPLPPAPRRHERGWRRRVASPPAPCCRSPPCGRDVRPSLLYARLPPRCNARDVFTLTLVKC